ncbi:hypothetical protein ACNOYE_25990 [Nannocystaceae bacterium ST9]
MKRRRLLGLLVLGMTAPLLGALPAPPVPTRKAQFTEIERRWVRMRVRVPELLKTSDKQAMQNLDGGFATRLVYDLGLFETGSKSALSTVHIEVRILLNPWTSEYEVETRIDGGSPSVRNFTLRDDAIAAATALDVRIASSSALTRGEQNATYTVHVVAQRNPIQSKTSGSPATARGQDRDLEVFSRWVGMFVRARPQADKTVQFRTWPPFYLVE